MRVGFAQAWQVLRSDSPQVEMEEIEDAGGLPYDAPEVLSAYGRQGRAAYPIRSFHDGRIAPPPTSAG